MATRIIKLKKLVQVTLQPTLQQALDSDKTVKRVIKLKKVTPYEPVKQLRIIKISTLPVPPIPGPSQLMSKAMEAFESIREYYTHRGLRIPQSDIKWFYEEQKREKAEYDEFWTRCAATKAFIDGTLSGQDDWTISLAMKAAREAEKKMPILETDIGPMPDYGTQAFWAWCHKRKKLKEQKEAAIIAAGGAIPLPKAAKKKQKA
jgi:hypothetical protein